MESPTARTPDASVDLARAARCGFPEVVYGEGKSADQIAAVFAAQRVAGQPSLATRVSDEVRAALAERIPDALVNDVARTVRVGQAKERSRLRPGSLRRHDRSAGGGGSP